MKIVLSEIKNSRQIFILENDITKCFFSTKEKKLNLIFDERQFDQRKLEQNTYGKNKTDTQKIEAQIIAFT